MKRFVMLSLVCSMVAISSAAVIGQTEHISASRLGWIAGCWELNTRNGSMIITESWMKPAGGTLIGMSRTVRDGKTVAWENIRIATTPEGLSYIARPHTSKEETEFRLARSSNSELVFENLAHDFPQRIIYRKSGSDSLFARTEGMKNGKLSGVDFPMKRVKCEE